MRSTQLFKTVQERLPYIRGGQFVGVLRGLRLRKNTNIERISRGLYRHIRFRDEGKSTQPDATITTDSIHEEQFYKPFADYLVDELEESTKAVALGGNIFSDRWGTPDVIGKNESQIGDIIKHGTEIISAEIKTDATATSLITAFGQACAYKIFSHKAYLVIPKMASDEAKSRIESLCLIFGIGLIFFDRHNPTNPNFEIRVRAVKHEPDWFYVNKYIELIKNRLW